MKKEDDNKTERLLKMHEQAERLGDDDIKDALDSAELNTLSSIKRAMAAKRAHLSEEEIDGQWRRFVAERLAQGKRGGGSARWSWMKIAAMFVGVVLMAGVAFAAIRVMVGSRQEASPKTEKALTASEQSPASAASTAALADSLSAAASDSASVVKYDDVELQDVLTDMAAYHHLTLQYENEQSKHIRVFFKWNKRTDVASIVEILSSYDRINIERKGNVLIIK